MTAPSADGVSDIARKPSADQRQRADRLGGKLAAQRDRLAAGARLVDDLHQRAQHRRRKRIEAVGDAPVAAVGGEQELHQIVGADRKEIHARDQRVELEQQRRHLDHGADLDAVRQLVAAAAQRGELALDQLLGLVELGDRSRPSGT